MAEIFEYQGPAVYYANHVLWEGEGRETAQRDEYALIWKAGRGRAFLSFF